MTTTTQIPATISHTDKLIQQCVWFAFQGKGSTGTPVSGATSGATSGGGAILPGDVLQVLRDGGRPAVNHDQVVRVLDGMCDDGQLMRTDQGYSLKPAMADELTD